jgi:hypothetical protein
MAEHKTFVLDVPFRSDFESRIKARTTKVELLTYAFFLDETPKLPRYGMENIDNKLRELRRNAIEPFG